MSLDVVCTAVSRTYATPAGSVEALRALDARFPAGSLTAVVGPSGTGKSTLLRMIGAVDPVDGGAIRVGGASVGSLRGRTARAYRRDTVTYLAQRAAANLVPQLTVAEQLGPRGGAFADLLGIRHRIGARAGELSGGEQARAALAVGLSRGTPVVLVDEPTAELDDASAAGAIAALRAATEEGRTVIVATHDPAVTDVADGVVTLGDRLALGDAPPRSAARRSEPMIALDAVTKRFDGRAVVDDATLAVGGGEIAVLLGRSGSGKSTLLMIAGAWTRADAGRVAVPGGDGRVPRWSETTYVPQRFGLLPELSIAENVALPSRLAGGDESRTDPLLVALALAPLRDRLPGETSIGQQQRAALARALAVQPRALLADEPTSHQDASSAELVWRAIAAAAADGTACLVATHDEAAAMRADRVWRIEDGRVDG